MNTVTDTMKTDDKNLNVALSPNLHTIALAFKYFFQSHITCNLNVIKNYFWQKALKLFILWET